MLVEYYDTEAAELYDLAADPAEAQNVAVTHPDRVLKMRATLAAWREANSAQTNRPNPGFNPDRYRELYEEVDASRFDPLGASRAVWEKMWEWRQRMNTAVQAGAKGRK